MLSRLLNIAFITALGALDLQTGALAAGDEQQEIIVAFKKEGLLKKSRIGPNSLACLRELTTLK